VFRGVATAAANEIDVAFIGEVTSVIGHVLWEEVEAGGGEGVREASVGIAGDVGGGDFGKVTQKWFH